MRVTTLYKNILGLGLSLVFYTSHVYYVTDMIQSFADETTADLFRERSTKDARRIPRDLWRVVGRKLKMLDVAQRLSDLRSPPGNRLEVLKGNQRGRHSIRVNEQYRVTFRWEGNHAYEVRCEDYHS
jgi:proteic killer suppression protein